MTGSTVAGRHGFERGSWPQTARRVTKNQQPLFSCLLVLVVGIPSASSGPSSFKVSLLQRHTLCRTDRSSIGEPCGSWPQEVWRDSAATTKAGYSNCILARKKLAREYNKSNVSRTDHLLRATSMVNTDPFAIVNCALMISVLTNSPKPSVPTTPGRWDSRLAWFPVLEPPHSVWPG